MSRRVLMLAFSLMSAVESLGSDASNGVPQVDASGLKAAAVGAVGAGGAVFARFYMTG